MTLRRCDLSSRTICYLTASHMRTGAGNGTRTRDPELGRLALYQLSYSREKWWRGKDSNLRRHRRQIYSLLPLATRVPLRYQQYLAEMPLRLTNTIPSPPT